MSFIFFHRIKLQEGSVLSKFLEETKGMDAENRGRELEKFNQIASIHEEVAAEGQTAPPNREDNLVTHFVSFVHRDGFLYELDGRRLAPVNHGSTTAENLLKVRAWVIIFSSGN
jgi:ubiquitin carboxyl-terminal hydrolase L3